MRSDFISKEMRISVKIERNIVEIGKELWYSDSNIKWDLQKCTLYEEKSKRK